MTTEGATLEREEVDTPDEDEGLSVGFAKVRGDEAPETPAKEEPAAPSAADDAKAQADAKAKADADARAAADAEWNALPASVRARIERGESVAGTVDKLSGHIGAMKQQIERLVTAGTAAAAAKGGDAPSKAQIADASATTERWKRLKEDFPDWAEAMEERLAAMPAGQPIDTAALKKEVTGEVDARVSQGIDSAEERAYLRMKHPEWKKTVKTPEFSSWLKGQPEKTQALAASEAAEDAITLLDGYAEHAKQAEATRKEAEAKAAAKARSEKRLAGAIVPTGTGQGAASPGISDDEALERGAKKVRGERK